MVHFERRGSQGVITLTSEEVSRLQEGTPATTRNGLVDDSKIEVYPYSQIDPTKRLNGDERFEASREYLEKRKNGQETKAQALVLGNEDLLVYLPDEALNDVRIGAFKISPDEIETPSFEGSMREGRLQVIPEGGLIVNLGGSLERYNTDDDPLPSEGVNGRWTPYIY